MRYTATGLNNRVIDLSDGSIVTMWHRQLIHMSVALSNSEVRPYIYCEETETLIIIRWLYIKLFQKTFDETHLRRRVIAKFHNLSNMKYGNYAVFIAHSVHSNGVNPLLAERVKKIVYAQPIPDVLCVFDPHLSGFNLFYAKLQES